jgi:hypothetical protein
MWTEILAGWRPASAFISICPRIVVRSTGESKKESMLQGRQPAPSRDVAVKLWFHVVWVSCAQRKLGAGSLGLEELWIWHKTSLTAEIVFNRSSLVRAIFLICAIDYMLTCRQTLSLRLPKEYYPCEYVSSIRSAMFGIVFLARWWSKYAKKPNLQVNLLSLICFGGEKRASVDDENLRANLRASYDIGH